MDGLLERLSVMLVLGYLGGGCAQSHDIERVMLCPTLVVGEGVTRTTYGGLASRDRFAPRSCVEIFIREERIAHTYAGFDGNFAVQFLLAGDASDEELELRVTDEDGNVERIFFTMTATSSSEISYVDGTVPLAAYRGGRLVFDGSLEPTPETAAPLDEVWLANWSLGTVSAVSPTPTLGVPFTAAVPGLPGSCASPIAHHANGGVGGCWWPMGGGGCAPFCTVEDLLAGTCPIAGGTFDRCMGRTGRGCTVVEVEEDSVSVPPPVRPDTVPVPPPESVPFDGGVDAPLPDVPELPDVPIDTPMDVPPPDAELM